MHHHTAIAKVAEQTNQWKENTDPFNKIIGNDGNRESSNGSEQGKKVPALKGRFILSGSGMSFDKATYGLETATNYLSNKLMNTCLLLHQENKFLIVSIKS